MMAIEISIRCGRPDRICLHRKDAEPTRPDRLLMLYIVQIHGFLGATITTEN